MEKSFELKKELQDRLEDLCRITEEPVREAVERYLENMNDLLIAAGRDKDERDELIGLDEMRQRLGLEN